MKKKTASGIIPAFMLMGMLMLTSTILEIKAQPATRKAGVSAGYSISYGVTATWTSNDPDATTPQYILESQQLAYFSNVVQSVSGTNVTFNAVKHFQNGTEKSETRWIDVDTGHAGIGSASGYMSFIAANLTAGDLIYTGLGPGGGEINETITRTYLGQPTEVNHVTQTTSSSAYHLYVDAYWNRATGAQYEVFENHTGYTAKGETTYATTETAHIYVIIPDSTNPTISDVGIQPSDPTPEDNTSVSAIVSDDVSGVKVANLYYSTDGSSTWSKIVMTITGSTYTASIPKQNVGTTVQYYVEAYDNSMNKIISATKSYTVRYPPIIVDPFPPIGIAVIIAGIIVAFLVYRKRKAHREPSN